MAVLHIVIAIAFAAWLIKRGLFKSSKLDVPHVQFEEHESISRYISGYRSLMERGYTLYTKNGRPFSIRNPSDENRPLVILPMKYLAEVRHAPQNKLSFSDFLEKVVGGPEMNPEVTRMARLSMNRSLDYMVQTLHEECLFAWTKVIPSCKDWTSIQPTPILNELFARIAARIMTGPELCRDEKWIQVVLSYTDATIKAIRGVRAKYHPSLRFLARYLDANTRSVLKLRRTAANMLRPSLEFRMSEPTSNAREEGAKYNDAIKWLADVYRARSKQFSADQLAQDEFILNVASISSASATALSIIYDLVEHPDVVEEIRAEITKVKNEQGIWTRQSLGTLWLLDSFMKESMRLHTLQQLTVQRTALVPWTFKDGFHLPTGTLISFASQQLNLDDDIYPSAASFDARRFLRKRQELDPNKFHFASVSDDYITFGAGFHACPGRFLAQDILKLMLIQLISRYDFRLAGDNQKRPQDIAYNFSNMPDMATQIVLREKASDRATEGPD
ncbi:cytochrome P450 [Hypoxylon sp. FL1857]|nr:cytochrome P450 [Hypoxylon sp. FL1857]